MRSNVQRAIGKEREYLENVENNCDPDKLGNPNIKAKKGFHSEVTDFKKPNTFET